MIGKYECISLAIPLSLFSCDEISGHVFEYIVYFGKLGFVGDLISIVEAPDILERHLIQE